MQPKMKTELKLNGDLLILARYNHNLPKGPELTQISDIWGENFKFMTLEPFSYDFRAFKFSFLLL